MKFNFNSLNKQIIGIALLGLIVIGLITFGLVSLISRVANTNTAATKPPEVSLNYEGEYSHSDWKDDLKVFYEEYSFKTADLKGIDKTNIYFFVKEGCNQCIELEKKILESKDKAKSNTAIFKVDMDNHANIVKQYKISVPGTIVVVKYSDKSEVLSVLPTNKLYPQNLEEIIKLGEIKN